MDLPVVPIAASQGPYFWLILAYTHFAMHWLPVKGPVRINLTFRVLLLFEHNLELVLVVSGVELGPLYLFDLDQVSLEVIWLVDDIMVRYFELLWL